MYGTDRHLRPKRDSQPPAANGLLQDLFRRRRMPTHATSVAREALDHDG